MSTSLTKQASPSTLRSIIPGIDSELSAACRRLVSSVSVGTDLAVSIPDELRDRMRARVNEIDRLLKPARDGDRHKVRAAVALTLSGWLNAKTDNPGAHIDLLVEAIADLPLWAIEAALRDLLQGKVPHCNVDFPPSSARMHAHTRSLMRHIEAERATLVMTLKANEAPRQTLTPMKKTTHKSLTALAEQLRADQNKGPSPAALKHYERIAAAERASIIAAYRVTKGEPQYAFGLPLSPSLLKTLGK
jgi:hypothetical protein